MSVHRAVVDTVLTREFSHTQFVGTAFYDDIDCRIDQRTPEPAMVGSGPGVWARRALSSRSEELSDSLARLPLQALFGFCEGGLAA